MTTYTNRGSIWQALVLGLAACTVVLSGAWLVFLPSVRNDVRRGDALFAAGRYHDAYGVYREAAQRQPLPSTLTRLGMIQTVRGDAIAASQTFARALQAGVRGRDYELLRLYQGRAALLNHQRAEAFDLWRTIEESSALFPYRQVLQAEALLASSDYGAAEAAYQRALSRPMLPPWQQLVQSRIAALRATSDPTSAQAMITNIAAATPLAADNTLLAPLLPSPAPTPEALSAALRESGNLRARMLGHVYFEAGLFALAEVQFAAANTSADALSVQAYAAYARLRGGDQAGGQKQLGQLVAAHPENAQARSLLALVYLDSGNMLQAKVQLEAMRALAPQSPDTFLAWGQWYAAQSDYIAAANEYRRALAAAPIEQRPTYLLALARFHLDTTVRACEDGRPAAEEAAQLGDSAQAWTALAEAQLACSNPSAARDAAVRALERDPTSPEANFYHGQALAMLGERNAARQALVAAADLAPDSDWRMKAERRIEEMGL